MKSALKIKFLTVVFISTLVLTAALATLPVAIAQKNTFTVVSFAANPTGVNQQVLIVYGITDATVWPQPGWEGLTLTIERPDGQVETFDNLRTDTTGLSGMVYTPTQVGTHYVKVYFPEQELEYSTLGLPAGTMLASESERVELIVQEDPIQYAPGVPLPQEYWTRTIDSQLREWYKVTGNWLEDSDLVPNRYAPYNEHAPNTAHILWAKPLSKGGLAGGYAEIHAFTDGDAYEGLFQDRVIIGGVLYYNAYNTRGDNVVPPESQEVVAIDIHTGELKWQKPLVAPDGSIGNLDFGQQMYWDAFNHHAVYSFLWDNRGGGTWHAFDPFSGDWSFTIENVPGGDRVHGKAGEILVYTMNQNEGWLSLWNSTNTVNPRNYGDSADGSFGRNIGRDVDDRLYTAERGIEWNVSIPTDLPQRTNFFSALIMEDRIISSNTGNIFGGPQAEPEFFALSLKPGQEGQLMWRKTWTPPVKDLWVHFTPNFLPSLEDGVFIIQAKETGQNWGLDIDTGNQIWGPTEKLPDIASTTNLYFPRWGQAVGADGVVVLGGGMGGSLRGHDVQTGQELWRYDFNDQYSEILWSQNWPMTPQFVTDGKVYIAHQEHSPLDPKPRHAPFVVVDLQTGEEVFTADGMFRSTRWGGQHIIADSIMVAMDSYDQTIYAVGKGPTEITVDSAESMTLGSKTAISGTIMDVSPGTEDPTIKLRFPKGVPVVHDDSMSDWMKYVYKQFPQPMASGVTVKLEAVDPNSNYQDYGTVTSDPYGNFGFSFEPEVPGLYMLIATFEGSEAYYGSTDTTYIEVNPAPTPTTPIEPEEPTEPEVPTEPEEPEPEAPLISTEIAIVAAVAVIAVVGIVAYWVLRRRK
jgi:outer membrane protein assembly factor BamB